MLSAMTTPGKMPSGKTGKSMSSLPLPLPKLTRRQIAVCKKEMSLCGGVNLINGAEIAWTGVDPFDTSDQDTAANGCYRPIEPDKARKVEDKCVQPLTELRRLQMIDTTVTKKQVPLISG